MGIELSLPIKFAFMGAIPHLLDAGPIIRVSRVDQAECDEMERGRLHGCGSIENGDWVSPARTSRMKLNKGFDLAQAQIAPCTILNRYPGGEPLIEAGWPPMPVNGTPQFAVPFPYLSASIGGRSCLDTVDFFNISDMEYRQAEALAVKFGLNGKWGCANRLPGDHHWHEDHSTLTFVGDNCFYTPVYAADNQPQYIVELFNMPEETLILPACYLRRSGFWGPRRVFFPPEENIAIWYNRKIDDSVRDIVISANPYFVMNGIEAETTAAGCLPGGASSVPKTDISTLRSRHVGLVCNPEDRLDLETTVKMTARLRHEYITPEIVFHEGTTERFVSVNLEALCDAASRHDIFIPEELRRDYLGDVTVVVKDYVSSPIVENLVYFREATFIHAQNLPPYAILTAITGIPAIGESSAIFVGDEPPLKLKDLTGKIMRCDFLQRPPEEHLPLFGKLTAGVRTVVIANNELISKHTDTCVDILRSCAADGRGVIFVSRASLPGRLADMVSRELTAFVDDQDAGACVIADHNAVKAWKIDRASGVMEKLPDSVAGKYLTATTPSSYNPGRQEIPQLAFGNFTP